MTKRFDEEKIEGSSLPSQKKGNEILGPTFLLRFAGQFHSIRSNQEMKVQKSSMIEGLGSEGSRLGFLDRRQFGVGMSDQLVQKQHHILLEMRDFHFRFELH